MAENHILIESESPVCPAIAHVEETDTTVYFYIFYPLKPQGEQVKLCWVCNRKPAPDSIDPETMKDGNAPMHPAKYVAHDPAGISLDPDTLEIVWLEEGESAALLENKKVIALIPAWSGMKGFHGYSIYAKDTGPYAWTMNQAHETLSDRVRQSMVFWSCFADKDFWGKVQTFHKDILEKYYGPHTQYYAIDGGKFPPRGLMEGRKDGIVYGCTLGVSMFRQPLIEIYDDDPDQHNRIEFGFAVEEAYSEIRNEAYNCFMTLARAMHEQIVFFAHGNTNTWKNLAPDFHAFLLLNTREIPQIKAPEYKLFLGDPVNLLWAVPVTEKEYNYLLEHGYKALLAYANDLSRIHIFDGKPKFHLP